jgi:superoxide dismutase, Cu-Zn family
MQGTTSFGVTLLACCLLIPAAFSASPPPAVKTWTVEGSPPVATAVADILDLNGAVIGQASFKQGPQGVLIDVTTRGLTPGKHGLHFHAVGQCDAAGKFTSAQHHMGLDTKPHGLLNPKGHHAGDLQNLFVGADGVGVGEFYSSDVQISGKASKGKMLLLDNDGSTLIIHEKADNGFDQPSGGAGGRAACGVIRAQ